MAKAGLVVVEVEVATVEVVVVVNGTYLMHHRSPSYRFHPYTHHRGTRLPCSLPSLSRLARSIDRSSY